MEGSFGSRASVCFEVEKVIGISSDGTYQVQWAPAWVSKFHLVGCEHLIQEFLQQQTEKENIAEVALETPHILNEHKEQSEVCHQESETLSYQNENSIFSSEHHKQLYSGGKTLDSKTLCSEKSLDDKSLVNDSGNDGEPFVEQGAFDLLTEQEVFDISVKIEEGETEEMSYQPPLTPYPDQPSVLLDTSHDNGALGLDRVAGCSEDCEYESDAWFQKDASSGKKYICPVCQKVFIDKTHFTSHVRTHKGMKPYVCNFCSKAFTTSGNLTQHIRLHTGERPYSCDKCGKSFTRNSELNRHSRLHTGLKPYSCEACGKSFAFLSNRKYHLSRCLGTTGSHADS